MGRLRVDADAGRAERCASTLSLPAQRDLAGQSPSPELSLAWFRAAGTEPLVPAYVAPFNLSSMLLPVDVAIVPDLYINSIAGYTGVYSFVGEPSLQR